jgi:hypothetical protein
MSKKVKIFVIVIAVIAVIILAVSFFGKSTPASTDTSLSTNVPSTTEGAEALLQLIPLHNFPPFFPPPTASALIPHFSLIQATWHCATIRSTLARPSLAE